MHQGAGNRYPLLLPTGQAVGKRIAPVRITEFTVTEEAFDVNLNPIRAKVSLGMRVLSIDDVPFEERSGGLFMSYLKAKEQLAQQGKSKAFGALGITGIP